ncbi:Bug family tripartite tricarboxylate transporter substrate binding protein [Pseudorhodoferax sp.]|uniref:Bug family tripartite tricarboxylate transporter substrate binding protein n=1 Tax=Pseudorhodoferax sp. TaxID=1993553 RepID=UPI002DD68C3D|nr:tripartite tricarboxylate transporter substrate binding protein [Pseudorhodoferax sp.]
MNDTRPLVLTRRSALAGAALALAAPTAWAQALPNKPIKLIVNFPPGGAADVLGRALAQQLGEQTGQQVVVENRPGANGNIGADAVAKSPADGSTLLMSSGGAMTVNPFLYTRMPFDAEKDLLPVSSVARVLVYLVVHPSLPVNTVAEFVAHAKANPGKLSYGTPGTGSSPHLATEMFRRQAGFEATHVPYKGAAPALTDLLAGQVQFMFDPGPGLRHVKDGKLRLLAVGSPRRSSQLPATPTLAELGITGFDADTTFGVYAPGGTPAALVAALHDAINKALGVAKVQEVVKSIGGEPATMSRNEFIQAQQRDRDRFGAFIREIGLKVE